jgi:hypothetical protein
MMLTVYSKADLTENRLATLSLNACKPLKTPKRHILSLVVVKFSSTACGMKTTFYHFFRIENPLSKKHRIFSAIIHTDVKTYLLPKTAAGIVE